MAKEKKHKFVLVRSDQWDALYVDGVEVFQHHEVDLVDWLSKYGVDIKERWAEMDPDLEDAGHFAKHLTDVTFDK